ncbi:2-dehydro-3-deoxygalactonokinase [Pelagibacterium xiamenense]|uniref:2-dehydro-3-deoxygalactonokinase n=1 Tax=Pelagibacterium xiamenense TaxID=2901140 RepID=UPI001E43E4E6|nr:2-dehydro-3-deoxygalactonokinase [Pelagibacterium xiamenense]MCD7059810.1 2-dehydro-3-deoxygalactonokinase [Pelagibacterium xiamenense]
MSQVSDIVADWIAVDWGTSNMRAWAMGAGGAVLAHGESNAGMGSLRPEQFEGALLSVVAPWLKPDGVTEVIACGMVGARQGWTEASYRAVPCPPVGGTLTDAPTRNPRIRVRIVAGLRQDTPADVMRGEETQIAGFVAQRPGFSGPVCLPGTHTKWADLRGGEVEDFSTVMTGELFALLSERSVLRHSVGDGWDKVSFEAGVADALAAPELVTGRLFALRAQSLLADLSADAARARLSGLLIGLELAGTRARWDGGIPVAIIGNGKLAQLYADALALSGAQSTIEDADTLTVRGLSAAYLSLKETAV